MLIYVFFVDREEIIALVAGMVEPCEMVDAKHIDKDIAPVDLLDSKLIGHDACQNSLCTEHLMTTAEGFDLREYCVECFYA